MAEMLPVLKYTADDGLRDFQLCLRGDGQFEFPSTPVADIGDIASEVRRILEPAVLQLQLTPAPDGGDRIKPTA